MSSHVSRSNAAFQFGHGWICQGWPLGWRGGVMLLVLLFLSPRASAREEFEGWDLEPSVGQAHLVMVARVASISRVTIVEGAKTDVALREYRFQPVRVLKGIFQRDELSMTPADLGIPATVAASPLKEGEFRLLILVQQQGRSVGCVTAAPGVRTFAERVPRLSGPDDPLVTVVETLIQVADSRSRRERATLLLERMNSVNGLPAVPLLSSLRSRADWASADARAYVSAARLANDSEPAVRDVAIELLRDMLANDAAPDDLAHFDAAAQAIRGLLDSDEGTTQIRVAALGALGELYALRTGSDDRLSRYRDVGHSANRPGLIALSEDHVWARERLMIELSDAATYAERAAAVSALDRIADPNAVVAVFDSLTSLPLDATPEIEATYIRAAVRLDSPKAEQFLLDRLRRSMTARQSLQAEIEQLGRMQSDESMPLLLAAAKQHSTSRNDRLHIAKAFGELGDDRAVPVLTRWLGSDDHQLREPTLTALELIDSEMAAREIRPLLKSEPHLPYKLRIARLLARHGFDDGYALATEHLADAGQTAAATLVLIALDDPRTDPDLSAILAERPDRRWRTAALSGLAAIGEPEARQQLLTILSDDRNPMAAEAAEAAGVVSDESLLLPLAALAQSRNDQLATAALTALRRSLSGARTSPLGLAAVDVPAGEVRDGKDRLESVEVSPEARNVISTAVASLVSDPYVEANLRQQAFAVARLLKGDGYEQLLAELADQSELEGTRLMTEVQEERRRVP